MSPKSDIDEARKGLAEVVIAELRCVVGTMALLFRHAIALPRRNVGLTVRFADGTQSRIYRETAMRRRSDDDLVLIAVRFRLKFIGLSPFGHWLFRLESLLNTLLFAAHPGFETKLWLTDLQTGFYRGIYEWSGRDVACEYAETLRVVLEPWVEDQSFEYRIIEGWPRDAYITGEMGDDWVFDIEDGWWLPIPTVEVRI